MLGTCKICGATGGSELFYKNSSMRCKECVHRINRERYHAKYKADLKAARRAKDYQQKVSVITLSDAERAYAAGLIDGEGCIRLTKRGEQGGTGLRVGQYTLTVEVTNTSKAMLDWLMQRFGGSLSYAEESYELNRKAKWHWRVSANKALYALDAIFPYLIVKRTQGKLGRRFQRYAQYAGRAVTPKIQALHEKFYRELRVLNKRGVR